MNEKLQQYLDGEIPLDALTPAERAEALEWRDILADAAELRSVTAPPWIETRVMATLPARPHRSWLGSAAAWLTSPQPMRIRPLSLGLAGAAALALLLFMGRTPETATSTFTPVGGDVHNVSDVQPAIIYVQFVLADRSAKSVTVAGDFNGWDVASTHLADTDRDGVWTGMVALRPGLHKYMFVIDGKRWVTDPEAERYLDDGFGMRNAVITITPPNGRTI
jgi:hypothetical protein